MEKYEDFDAIGMSRPYKAHQHVMSCLVGFIRNECDTDEYWVLTEEPISYDRDDMTPDIVVEEKDSDEIVLIVEICRSLANETHIEEYRQRCPKAEIFVVDYVEKTWYSFGANADADEPSYSEFLGEDLDDAIDWADVELLERKRLEHKKKRQEENRP